jgi:hypothetical protein
VLSQERTQVSFSSNPYVDLNVKKQGLDQSWYIQSDWGSTGD